MNTFIKRTPLELQYSWQSQRRSRRRSRRRGGRRSGQARRPLVLRNRDLGAHRDFIGARCWEFVLHAVGEADGEAEGGAEGEA